MQMFRTKILMALKKLYIQTWLIFSLISMAYTAPKGVFQMVVASQNGSDVPNSSISGILTGVIRRRQVHNTQDSFSFSYTEA